jgi:plasmid stability protein
MTHLTLHDLDDDLTARLNQRATRHGRSPEEEARDILQQALGTAATSGEAGLGTRIHRRFAAVGGVELPVIPCSPLPPAPVLPDPDATP